MRTKFFVYTRKDCSWCDKVKDFLKEEGMTFEERDVFDPGVLNFLMKEGLKTVPQVFREDKRHSLGMEHIGGYTDTIEWFKKLKEEESNGPHN